MKASFCHQIEEEMSSELLRDGKDVRCSQFCRHTEIVVRFPIVIFILVHNLAPLSHFVRMLVQDFTDRSPGASETYQGHQIYCQTAAVITQQVRSNEEFHID